MKEALFQGEGIPAFCAFYRLVDTEIINILMMDESVNGGIGIIDGVVETKK
jgi:hypothetical protein